MLNLLGLRAILKSELEAVKVLTGVGRIELVTSLRLKVLQGDHMKESVGGQRAAMAVASRTTTGVILLSVYLSRGEYHRWSGMTGSTPNRHFYSRLDEISPGACLAAAVLISLYDMHPAHFIRNCSSFAALSLLLWDSIITFDHEYQHIWQPPTGPVKRIYLFARYFGLCSQIASSAAMRGPLASTCIRPKTCAFWFGCQLVSFLSLLTALEMILSLRLYALYEKSRSVGILLLIMITTGVIVSGACGVRTVRLIRFDETCVLRKTPYEVVYFSTFTCTRQTLLWMLTMHKRNVGRLGGASRAPIVSLMLRDGALIFCVISAVLGTVTPSSVLIPAVAQAMIPWTLTFVSMLTCRLILNMQRLQTQTTSDVLELTTNIVSESFEPDQSRVAGDVKGPRASNASRRKNHSARPT
ncbi:hypothetical protein LshimejAT787_0705550 [Lyophyllum shimeji]|uniref:DUF6533 domain-containing protein n=1 Tax=Lyophyllum shimeji TaxID=47721 RepID=A0A9P3UQC9_LYOSH|nr:hypothetical protein LshimejAT787_0705550 [Lyophyllum shimeji]